MNRILWRHQYVRPSWRCRRCGAPWPCQPARLGLLRDYRDARTTLMVLLSMRLDTAARDLAVYSPGTPGAELYRRFFSWARRR